MVAKTSKEFVEGKELKVYEHDSKKQLSAEEKKERRAARLKKIKKWIIYGAVTILSAAAVLIGQGGIKIELNFNRDKDSKEKPISIGLDNLDLLKKVFGVERIKGAKASKADKKKDASTADFMLAAKRMNYAFAK